MQIYDVILWKTLEKHNGNFFFKKKKNIFLTLNLDFAFLFSKCDDASHNNPGP